MKYESQLQELKNTLSTASSVVVALPAAASVDLLAAGLSLYLSLKAAGKQSSIITETPVLVDHQNLFGVGDVSQTISTGKGGDLVLTLENVVMPDGSVPALEKLDWYPEGSNLNLVFHVVAGQRFEPAKVEHKYTSGKIDLIITVGVTTLTELGNVYASNQAVFTSTPVANFDNNALNTSFGNFRVLDSLAASHSQMMTQVLPDLGLPTDADIASNLLLGIYNATNNLTANTNPDTFMAVGMALQWGGRMPMPGASASQPIQPVVTPQPVSQPVVQSSVQVTPEPVQPVSQPVSSPQADLANNPFLNPQPAGQGFDMRLFQPQTSPQVVPPVSQPVIQPIQATPTPSSQPAATPIVAGEHEVMASTPQEQTFETADDNFSPAPDWLTPKVYKGSGGVG